MSSEKKSGENKNGIKRWLKISNDISTNKTRKNETRKDKEIQDMDINMDMNADMDTIRNANKKLHKFWTDLADTKHSIFIYKNKYFKAPADPRPSGNCSTGKKKCYNADLLCGVWLGNSELDKQKACLNKMYGFKVTS